MTEDKLQRHLSIFLHKLSGSRSPRQLCPAYRFVLFSAREADVFDNWEYAALYNPHKGFMYRFHVKSMIARLTGRESASETFIDFLDDLTRDIQIDSHFERNRRVNFFVEQDNFLPDYG